MNQIVYMQVAGQHREQLLREAEMERLVAQVTKSGRENRTFDMDFFAAIARRASILNPFHGGAHTIATQTVTVAESECALRATLVLMHKDGIISDYDEQFVQRFTQTFERELTGQGQVDQDIVAVHA
jgi:hypothetical protein